MTELQSSHWAHLPFSQANPETGLLHSSARHRGLAAWNPLASELLGSETTVIPMFGESVTVCPVLSAVIPGDRHICLCAWVGVVIPWPDVPM